MKPFEVYALKNLSDDMKFSSSGGAFPTIVQVMNAESPVTIFGAAFDSDMNLKHQKSDYPGNYNMFCGSKYIQSDIRGIYESVLNEVCVGGGRGNILFVGCPCQVDGIKKYLKQKAVPSDKILFVDIICHGTAPQYLWRDYVDWLEKKNGKKLIKFDFRYPNKMERDYFCRAVFEDGFKIEDKKEVTCYSELFFKDYLLRESCEQCRYACIDRISDLTIGDFWGIEKVMPDFPYRYKVSEVLVNTLKGQAVIKKITEKAKSMNVCIEQCFSDEYITYQKRLCKPAKRNARSVQFCQDYKTLEFEDILKKYTTYGLKNRLKERCHKVIEKIGIKYLKQEK